MTLTRTLATTAAALLLTAGTALAAPCATGTTTNAHGMGAHDKSADKSSMVDGKSDTKVSPGAKAESPGTVGALDNVGANTQPKAGEKKPPEGKVITGQNADDC
ncbi:hypothetical protein G3T14_15595 [Methylobacterium sp. BTF04]|uniref:hypothetical protein n=1 Tax=Methylobacterium sp. BTF04 TaxID=2708300 RepID=UPI0013D26D8D|nr:hypothetical protein [Methylobacterium sp. BTF04]NEU13545.1 hypothetical protein [Methylobacterium sp. BTF04]